MTNIGKTTGNTPSPAPAQPHEGEASGSSPKLESLGRRDSSIEITVDNRLQKQNWLSRLFKGGSPSFESTSSRKTARVADSEATSPKQSLTDKKGKVRVDEHTRSRFPRLRQAYESFKNLFQKLLPSNVNKTFLKENYEALDKHIAAKINLVKSVITTLIVQQTEEQLKGEEQPTIITYRHQAVNFEASFQSVTQAYNSINNKQGEKVSKPDRQAFNVAVTDLATKSCVYDLDQFLLPK